MSAALKDWIHSIPPEFVPFIAAGVALAGTFLIYELMFYISRRKNK